ncbi:MAG: uroporphyrinogen-III C-methyltransferase [Candidatus Marinimicrobia bacterium]|nr:uroporphyrinogen-III C-methyltransferase [Candidatus Neomarinimicrobiota bacterium]
MKNGKVYLIGAGPGDPEYLTVKAFRLIKSADVVLYDTLTSEAIRNLAENAREILDVGKRPPGGGKRHRSQESINRLMVEKAKLGNKVVRLKGGDSNVFGRGGEEILYLAERKIRFEVVPGVSSILAAPGLANIPLTHRKMASSFTVITGHEDPTKSNSALDWRSLAGNIQAGGTLVILMGVRKIEKNVQALLSNGVPANIPVAAIERASYPEQKIVTGTLATIPELVSEHQISPPAIFVIGKVVSVRNTIQQEILQQEQSLPALIEHLIPELQSEQSYSLQQH